MTAAEVENLLWRNRMLRDRPDLPADRIPAHDEMVRLQAGVAVLEELLSMFGLVDVLREYIAQGEIEPEDVTVLRRLMPAQFDS